MRNTLFKRAACILASFLIVGASLASGRSEEPPPGMLEVYQLAQQAAEALNAGDNAKAAELIKQGRKIAHEAIKEKSSMPMQVASTGFKDARTSIEANDTTKTKADLQHIIDKLTAEVDFYKEHGKIK
jgi:hypothetical protein